MDLQLAIQACQEYDSGFGYYDFINNDAAIFAEQQQFIHHIKGENTQPTTININNIVNCIPNSSSLCYAATDDHELMMFNLGLIENSQYFYPPLRQDYLFDFMSTTTTTTDPNSSILMNPNLPDPNISTKEVEGGGDDDQGENDGSDNSSGTTTTTTTTTTTSTTKTTVDRSKTLTSERKRRGRMKEKLYSLRALVPNITKMDKASIIGDAVSYMQDLQMQAKKLKIEIQGLESSLLKGATGRFQSFFEKPKKTQVADYKNQITKNILQMDVFQVENRGFYVRLESNEGDGVAVSLYKALESLTYFDIQNSNFTTASERFILTSTIHVREGNEGINVSTLKIWVSKALVNQGFVFIRAPVVP